MDQSNSQEQWTVIDIIDTHSYGNVCECGKVYRYMYACVDMDDNKKNVCARCSHSMKNYMPMWRKFFTEEGCLITCLICKKNVDECGKRVHSACIHTKAITDKLMTRREKDGNVKYSTKQLTDMWCDKTLLEKLNDRYSGISARDKFFISSMIRFKKFGIRMTEQQRSKLFELRDSLVTKNE